MTVTEAVGHWYDVCSIERLTPDRGVAALVHGEQIALFLLETGDLFAIDHRDPFSGAFVLARGLVGDHDGAPTVASPVYKQRFDLRTGRCLDADEVVARTWPVREVGGVVQIGVAGP
jgi:nitrite reductase (NADH) small subunit